MCTTVRPVHGYSRNFAHGRGCREPKCPSADGGRGEGRCSHLLPGEGSQARDSSPGRYRLHVKSWLCQSWGVGHRSGFRAGAGLTGRACKAFGVTHPDGQTQAQAHLELVRLITHETYFKKQSQATSTEWRGGKIA